MPVKAPTLDDLKSLANDLGFHMTDSELNSYHALMIESIKVYDTIDAMPDSVPSVKYPRDSGYHPRGGENPFGAWYAKASVKGAAVGKLSGRTVVLKDNICLAGVPMMAGASILQGYIPEIDATIVERILEAGGKIVGKAVCEYLCRDCGSHTSATGPVHNPYKLGHTSGGSSSGCAALVAAGEVDMAVGGDQAGSIRVPASFCGAYGMKPTYGLVPYTGILSIELTLDHAGPITANVADNALLLEVIAGPDEIDPRQGGSASRAYSEDLKPDVSGLRIAMVPEGFGCQSAEPDVEVKVRAAARRLHDLGAVVEEVSIPLHPAGAALFVSIAVEGGIAMMKGNGFVTNHEDLFILSLFDALSAWRKRADELPATLKNSMLLGEYMTRTYHGRYYAKAGNLRRQLRAAYNQVLSEYDLLLMPTTPATAPPLPAQDAPPGESLARGLAVNTPQFNVTGHPAMSVPCGMSAGLPVGMMLIGRHFDESTIYRAAYAFEQSGDWRSM
jgi:amidase